MTNDWLIVIGVAAVIIVATFVFVAARKSKKQTELLPKETTAPLREQVSPKKIEKERTGEESVKAQAGKTLSDLTAEAEKEAPEFLAEPSAEKTARETLEEKPEEKLSVSLDQALEKTRTGFLGRIKGLFGGGKTLGSNELEELEEILYTSDLGPQTVQRLMSGIDDRLSGKEKSDFTAVRQALRDEMYDIFQPVGGEEDSLEGWLNSKNKPLILMIVGVNGAGKTTTIGKLAGRLSSGGRKVLVAAGDTFRAAAEDQLKIWSERAAVDIFSPPGVKDPSAVAFDACQKAKTENFDALIVDTAGRLHTQSNLMEELKKMKRVIGKAFPDAPHEVLLVLDANSGQNALIQAKSFHEALGVTGVVLTKLDGTAKGGVAVGVACELNLPIRLIGVGEGLKDLRPFSASEFVDSII